MRGIRWTGPKNPMADTALREPAGSLAVELERALGYPYLVVLRPLEFTRPVVIDEKTFQPGISVVALLIASNLPSLPLSR